MPSSPSPAERRVLCAILGAFTRKLTEEETREVLASVPSADQREDVRALCATSILDLPGAVDAFEKAVKDFSPMHDRQELERALWLLSTRLGCYLLTGYVGPFDSLSEGDKERALLGLSTSIFEAKRKLFGAMKRLGLFVAVAHVPPGMNTNPNLKALGYTAPARPPLPEYYTDLARCRVSVDNASSVFHADVVIIGSGIGGSMAARQLCLAGRKVLMLEKGPFWKGSGPILQEMKSFANIYERGPTLTSDDLAVSILAGKAVGGGGTVNWFCSLKPPHYVREEWADEYGLHQFNSPWFTKCLKRACETLGVQGHKIECTNQNQVLKNGCENLGYDYHVAHQQGMPTGDEGLCALGFKHGERQGSMGSLLLDAAKTGNFRFISGCNVEKVTFETGRKPRANGVVAKVEGGTPLTVKARAVVVAAGSLNSPNVLKRSGLKNRHIGSNLRLHPVTVALGDFEEKIFSGEGAPMTTVSDVVANMDGKGYGARIETPIALPAQYTALLNWKGAAHKKMLMARMQYMSPLIVLARDDGSGRVYEDSEGKVRVDYNVSTKDAAHMLEGLKKACNILVAAGAKVIHTCQAGVPEYETTELGTTDPKYQLWLEQVASVGIQNNRTGIFSAHQMGTCKMGTNEFRGVVKPTGETWEAERLFVCDTSVFPTPSGTNPMVTVAAIAHGISQHVEAMLADAELRSLDAPRMKEDQKISSKL